MLIVANYHYIRENFASTYSSIFGVTPNQFENQLKELSKYGDFISQEKLLEIKNEPLDKNHILISFDDGLSEQFELAKPILDKLGIPFVFFVNTENFKDEKVSLVHKIHMLRSKISSIEIIDFIANNFQVKFTEEHKKMANINYNYDNESTAKLKYLLNFCLTIEEQEKIINPLFKEVFNEKKVASTLYFDKTQLKTLFEKGNIGSHGHQHLPLGLYSELEITNDFSISQDYFFKNFGKKAAMVSYPYGSKEACKNVKNIASKNGFEFGFSMERAVNLNLKEPLMMARFDCNDLPGGKNNLFKNKDIFIDSNKSKWYR